LAVEFILVLVVTIKDSLMIKLGQDTARNAKKFNVLNASATNHKNCIITII